jgi:hypothetical protein
MLVGKLDIQMQKSEMRSMSFTVYQNEFNVDQNLKIRPKTLSQLQEAVGNTLEQTSTGNVFLNTIQKAQHQREKNAQMGQH